MADYVVVLIGQMKILASLIAIGLFAQRAKMISDENIVNFQAFLSRLILPCMLITMVGNGGTRADMLSMWRFLLATIIALSGTAIISVGISKCLKLERGTENMHAIVTSYGNGGFLGIPILIVMFPETGALVGAMFLLIEASMFWAVGPVLADSSDGEKTFSFKKLVSPLTIAILLGFVLIILNIELKGFVLWDTIAAVGGTTKYFAAVYIGAELGRQGLKQVFSNPKVFVSTPFKLIIFPIMGYFIFGKTGLLKGEQLIMLTFLLSTPTGMAVPILAAMGKSNQAYSTAGTMINTILCLFTMPFVMWLVTTCL